MKNKFLLLLFGVISGVVVGAVLTGSFLQKLLKKTQEMSDKYLKLYQMMNQWVIIKQERKHLESYFIEKDYKSIAIYGMSYAGERLYNEIKDSEINVRYGIDKNAENLFSEIEIITMEKELLPVDAIVVTSIYYFDSIKEELLKKADCPIISLEDILYRV